MPCALVSVLCVWARTSPTAGRSAARGGRVGLSTRTCATEVAKGSRWLFQLAWPPKSRPSLLLLRALAEVPRGSFAFYSENKLGKVFRKAKTSREALKMVILSLLSDRATADKKVQGVYHTVAAFSTQHGVVKSGAGCPGHP